MTIAEEVAALQERLTEAERARARAEGARDSAQAAHDRASEELKRDFGLASAEQAAILLGEMNIELRDLVNEISAKLDEIGF